MGFPCRIAQKSWRKRKTLLENFKKKSSGDGTLKLQISVPVVFESVLDQVASSLICEGEDYHYNCFIFCILHGLYFTWVLVALDSLLKCMPPQLTLAFFQQGICMDTPNELHAIDFLLDSAYLE